MMITCPPALETVRLSKCNSISPALFPNTRSSGSHRVNVGISNRNGGMELSFIWWKWKDTKWRTMLLHSALTSVTHPPPLLSQGKQTSSKQNIQTFIGNFCDSLD